MFHQLDNDSPGWECAACGQRWTGAADYIGGRDECVPAWTDRKAAELLAPIVWTGTEADEYAKVGA